MEIIHLDEAIIVVNKPAGLCVLPDGWDPEAPYLVSLLEESYGRSSDSSDVGIWNVHRLDKTTSGVIVFARTAEAHRELNGQFERHEVQKIYHAVLVGVPKWEERVAKHPLRVDVGHKHRTAVDNRRGKPAETRFRILKCFASHALVEARLMTGRTHQIRAHAYALGFPLLGDELYGSAPTPLIGRPALHAYSLTIQSPLTQTRQTFVAPYPPDFSRALEQVGV